MAKEDFEGLVKIEKGNETRKLIRMEEQNELQFNQQQEAEGAEAELWEKEKS